MEKIEPGKYVELAYTLYSIEPDNSEQEVYATVPGDPEKIVFGVTPDVVRPLEKAIEGLQEGDKFEAKATAAEAYGPYDPEKIVELDRDVFEVDGKFDEDVIKPGALLPMMTADGFRITGLVMAVTPDKVKLDFNHPLAGKCVVYKGTVLKVRDATPEEIQPAHGCGCSCGCHDEADGSCDCDHDADGCGCHDHHQEGKAPEGDCGCHCH